MPKAPLNAEILFETHLDDRGQALAVQLLQRTDAAPEAGEAINLTGLTVTFQMFDGAGSQVITNGTVTVTTAASGKCEYRWASGDLDTAGDFFGYFQIGSGATQKTFPADRGKLIVRVHAD